MVMRKSTPTWRHFKRPASISCAMNRCEAFKNLAASMVESSCFATGKGRDKANTELSAGAGAGVGGAGGGGAGKGGAGTGWVPSARAGETKGAEERTGTASPSSRNWSTYVAPEALQGASNRLDTPTGYVDATPNKKGVNSA